MGEERGLSRYYNPTTNCKLFNVTVNEILGINIERNEQKIAEYITRSSNCFNKQVFSEAADILRVSLKEYPNSYQIMSELIFILHVLYHKQSEDKKQEINLEITSLGNKIFKYCSDDMIRHKAKTALCAHYIYDLGDKKKAKEILQTMPKFDYGFQFFEPLCLNWVEKKRY